MPTQAPEEPSGSPLVSVSILFRLSRLELVLNRLDELPVDEIIRVDNAAQSELDALVAGRRPNASAPIARTAAAAHSAARTCRRRS